MDEPKSPMDRDAHDRTERGARDGQLPAGPVQTMGVKPGEAAESLPVTHEAEPRGPDPGGVRRILPWTIAALAIVVAVVAIGTLVVNETSEPQPVAQLTPEGGSAGETIPVDKETVDRWDLAEADFVSYGTYGAAEVWSTATPAGKRCIAVVVEGRTWVFRCTPPTMDTITEIDIESQRVPAAPSGEPTSNIRFVLHDEVVDVYLAPNPEGGYF
jgi:hypothetical protein